MLTKGYFIWQLEQCAPNINSLAERLSSAGVHFVVIKIADGVAAFPRSADGQRYQAEAIACFKANGIEVWGWSTVYGQHGSPVHDIPPELQAVAFADRIRAYGLSAAVIDAENFGGMRWNAARATIFMRHLRSRLQEIGLGSICLVFSSYRFPGYHSDFPVREFMAGCDAAMPQVYWIQSDPVADLRRCLDEYKALSGGKPIIPAGIAAADNHARWRPTTIQIQRFMDEAETLGLGRVVFWSWQHAYTNPEIWRTIATYGSSEPTRPPAVSLPVDALRARGVVTTNEVNFRTLPSTRGNVPIGQFSQGDAVSVTGQVITTEDPSTWYRVVVYQQEYWVAARYISLLPDS